MLFTVNKHLYCFQDVLHVECRMDLEFIIQIPLKKRRDKVCKKKVGSL